MGSKRIKIGIIGYGKRGTSHHEAILNSDELELCFICDPLKTSEPQQGVTFFNDYIEAIEQGGANAVIVATSIEEHFSITRLALSKGIHVLCEKPATTTSKEAQEIVQIAQDNDLALLIGYHLRFDTKIMKMIELIHEGAIGDVTMVRGRQSHDWGGQKPHGWLTQSSFGGTIVDNATHYIDLIGYLFGGFSSLSGISSTNGFGFNVEDTAIITGVTQKGILCSIETSWKDTAGRLNSLHIWGQKGTLRFEETNTGSTLELKWYEQEGPDWNILRTSLYYTPKGIETLNRKHIPKEKPAVQNLLKHFINMIGDNTIRRRSIVEQRIVENVECLEALKNNIQAYGKV